MRFLKLEYFLYIFAQKSCAILGRGRFQAAQSCNFVNFFANKVGAGSVGMDEVYARGLSCLVHVGPRQREGLAPHQEASAAPTSSV